jgi:hypothetical protein
MSQIMTAQLLKKTNCILVQIVNKLNRYSHSTITCKFDDSLARRCRSVLKCMCNFMHQNHHSQSPPSKRNAYQLMCHESNQFRMLEDQL